MIARARWHASSLVLVAALIVAGCGSDPETAVPEGAGSETVGSDLIDDEGSDQIPTLSAANLAEVDRIISELPSAFPNLDPALLDALTSLPFDDQGVWHANDYRLIGVVREVTLPKPLDLGKVSLPDISWDMKADDYTRYTFHYDSIAGLRTVSISIDLTLHKVVAIQPSEADDIKPSKKTKFPEQEDGGLG